VKMLASGVLRSLEKSPSPFSMMASINWSVSDNSHGASWVTAWGENRGSMALRYGPCSGGSSSRGVSLGAEPRHSGRVAGRRRAVRCAPHQASRHDPETANLIRVRNRAMGAHVPVVSLK
jgi:hypothetical protein